MQQIKLYCIPHAGGSSSFYLRWKKMFKPYIAFSPLDTGGKGSRMRECFPISFNEALVELYKQLKPALDAGQPYALYGHSLGCLLAYELARMAVKEEYKAPVHFFSSGLMPPDMLKHTNLSVLTDQEFLEWFYALDGIPSMVMDDKELQKIFLPILRADYNVFENYHYVQEACLQCNMSVFYGIDDPCISVAQINHWKNHTDKSCKFYMYSGGHFFIEEFQTEIVNTMNQTLSVINCE